MKIGRYLEIKNENKSKKTKQYGILAAVVLIVLSFIYIPEFFYPDGITDIVAGDGDLTNGVAVDNQIPSEEGAKGTRSNPFVILEIVPYEEYAEIGYLIDGCEPVDIKRMLKDSSSWLSTVGTNGGAIINQGAEEKFDLEEGDVVGNQNGQWTYVTWNTKTLTGYYERVEAGTGRFNQDIKGYDYIEAEAPGMGDYDKTEDSYQPSEQGDYIQIIKDAQYTKAENGDFIWVTVENLDLALMGTNHNAANIGDRVYTVRTDHYYVSYARYTYKNKNLFLKDVLNLAEAQIKDYQIMVKTILPSELNNNLGWIDRADLIYINPKSHDASLPKIWAEYNRLGKKPETIHTGEMGFRTEDLSWEATLAIFNKVIVAKDYAGIIIDATTYLNIASWGTGKTVRVFQFGKDAEGNKTAHQYGSDTGYQNNIYKLCLMLRSIDPLIFYNLYLNDLDGVPLITKDENGKDTGSYNRNELNSNEKLYWSPTTFMPANANGTRSEYNDWISNDSYFQGIFKCNPTLAGGGGGYGCSVVGRLYTYNGDCSLTQVFSGETISFDQKYTKELFDYNNENYGNSTSPAKAVDYILNYKGGLELQKASITVLDIEPCKDFTLTARDVRELLLTYTGTITIRQQTSAEFIGNIEDLNKEYDLIYLGLNTGMMNKDSNGVTVYNDSTLKEKIYLHVGDEVKSPDTGISRVNWGIPGADTDRIRLSGNDITKNKAEDLKDFLAAGYPIVIADKFLNGSNNLNTKYIGNTNNIDSSVIGRFITDYSGKQNVFTYSGGKKNSNDLMSYLSAVKPRINLISQPTAYNISEDADGEEMKDGKYYINGTNKNNRELEFQFQIIDQGDSASYEAILYVDANADGRFAKEEIQKKERFSSGDAIHTIKKTLHDSYVGVIPWKLLVYNLENSAVRTEITGYSAVKSNEQKKQTIKVLQINQNVDGIQNLNLQTDPIFEQYTKNLNDFKVDFITITISQYEKLFNAIPNEITDNSKITDNITKPYDKNDEMTDRLADYDMLILGFSDCYGNISKVNGALDNLANYIKSGKSVLFTHDTTSFNNAEEGYGYNVNRGFREILGMDRYGVNTGTALLKVDADRFDSLNIISSLYSRQKQGYTYYAAMRLFDRGRNPNSSYIYGAFKDLNNIKRNEGNVTNQVANLNEGQITSYPYKIGDVFTCAETHSQYYQLNMEDTDIVIWYTLETSSLDKTNMYSVSPKDSSNNYYIYNRGNITYSGMGHSKITEPGNEKIQEVKLFINTMIASYKAGLRAPAITVYNAVKMGSNEYYKYLDLDPIENTFINEETQDIEFSVTDFNLLSNTFTSDDLGIEVTLDGMILEVYAADGDTKVTYTVPKAGDTGKNLTMIKNSETYIVKYPIDAFGSVDIDKIYIYAENYKGLSARASTQFVTRVLFELD